MLCVKFLCLVAFVCNLGQICEARLSKLRRSFVPRKYVKGNSQRKLNDLKFIDNCNKFEFITQNVDHFGFNQVDTYQMRYIQSDTYWKGEASPIFFYTGNEGDIQWFCQNTGFVWELAQQIGALVVFAEHRYYGDSMPYGNQSSSKEHLNYLTSEQALADYAYLIKYIKLNYNGAEKSPVIAFGGSYGGMLAAWFRMKYPNIVVGALAASAPIFQTTTKCNMFNEVITNAFNKSDPLCPKVISRSWNIINKMCQSTEGLKQLTSIFKLCSPLKSATELKDYLSDVYGNVAMANYPYPAGFLAPLPAWPVSVMCEKMVNQSVDETTTLPLTQDDIKLITAIYEGINVYSNYTGQLECNNIDESSEPFGIDMWSYQTCTEFVFPMCSNGTDDMFEFMEWDYGAYVENCKKTFDVIPRDEWPVFYYGGYNQDLEYHTNIIFSNGDLDPWSSGGVLETINDKLPAIMIENGAHHLDLRSSNENDPQSVRAARLMETKNILEWIKEHQKANFGFAFEEQEQL